MLAPGPATGAAGAALAGGALGNANENAPGLKLMPCGGATATGGRPGLAGAAGWARSVTGAIVLPRFRPSLTTSQ
ncbi:MAG TPA: hypothetical protein VN700_01030 [Vicinamibacterales bacterium]|nr:hypothetical protein [Vicinamibacterales bacterium]